MTTYDAILPAGGRIDPEFAKQVGTDVKALIRFEDRSILERTLAALKGTGWVGRTIVIGGPEVHRSEGGRMADALLEEGSSGPDNILRGLRYLLAQPNPPSKVLVVTTDLPFLTPSLLDRFIELCPKDRDICVPLISRREWDARFPSSTATFVKLADGEWTTGCAYLIDVRALQNAMPQIERVFANRKSPIGMAKLLGPAFLAKFLTKRLTVADVEKKIQSMLGCTGAAVRNAPPELSYDIDYADDYEYAIRNL